MRDYLHINLAEKSAKRETLTPEQVACAGRYFIAQSLVESGAAKVDPLSGDNPLIFSVGPFAGTNFSNANRVSVGCRSPLT
ncbi:MAG: aldehyde ferredoxin oxidoreductase N-terminal domain-containing protein, partial [Gammaproteobacteria bacterium]